MGGIDLANRAAAIHERVDDRTRRLAVVFGLPLLDGVFISLVLAGMLESIMGIVVMGVLIFGGVATAAIILADTASSPRATLRRLTIIGSVAVPVAGIQAALAPNLAMVLNIAILERVAALVLVLLAISLVAPHVGNRLPSPWMVMAVGLLISVEPNGLTTGIAVSSTLLAQGAAAAMIGVVVAAAVAIGSDTLQRGLDPERLRSGAGVALAVVALSLVSPLPTVSAVLILLLALVLAVNPGEANPTRATSSTSSSS